MHTVNVTCTIKDQNGLPVVGANVFAVLSRHVIYEGFVVPRQMVGTTNESGVCVLALWPNVLGEGQSTYNITVLLGNTAKPLMSFVAVVPDNNCLLEEIAVLEPYPTVDAAAQALLSAQSALALAENTLQQIQTIPLNQTKVVAVSRELVPSDDGQILEVTVSDVTLTVPASGLAASFGCAVTTLTGTVFVASGGVVKLNGATTTLARASIRNPMFAIMRRASESNGYTVTGG